MLFLPRIATKLRNNHFYGIVQRNLKSRAAVMQTLQNASRKRRRKTADILVRKNIKIAKMVKKLLK